MLVCSCTVVQAQGQFLAMLADSAILLTKDDVRYDPSYYSIPYPNGDVPAHVGVCSDVVVRAYRKLGFDLQKAVHEDMRASFNAYPKNWGLAKPDKSIDHRRVPNLMTYFSRQGAELPKSAVPSNYLPGDVVCWSLGNGAKHIGIVASQKSFLSGQYMIVHNIGKGQVLEDCLLDWEIIGHYRFVP